MSQAEIQKMLDDAKRFEEDDRREKERIEARNRCETYAYQCKQSLEDYGSKLSVKDREKVENACKRATGFVEQNQQANKNEYEHQYNECQSVCSRILARLHQNNNNNDGHQSGPKVEEVD